MSNTKNYKFFKYDDETIVDLTLGNKNWDDLDEELKKIDDRREGMKIIKSVTLSSSGWTSYKGKYRYTYNNSNINSDCVVDVNIRIEDFEKSTKILPMNNSFNGGVYLYAKEKPTNNIICDIKITKEVI